MSSPYYRHEGAVPALGAVAALVGGLLAAYLAAWVYVYAEVRIPVVYVNVLLCLAFGAIVGAVPSVIMRWGNVRSKPFAFAVVGLCTVTGYFLCWVIWVCVTLDKVTAAAGRPFSLHELIFRPDILFREVSRINELGTWSIRLTSQARVNGLVLLLVWILEGGLIFLLAFGVARSFVTGLAFCEKCQQWCDEPRVIAHLEPVFTTDLISKMEAGDFRDLTVLARVPSDSPNAWLIEMSRCTGCDQLHTLTLSERSLTRGGHREVQQQQKILADKLLLSPESAVMLTNAFGSPAQ